MLYPREGEVGNLVPVIASVGTTADTKVPQ